MDRARDRLVDKLFNLYIDLIVRKIIDKKYK